MTRPRYSPGTVVAERYRIVRHLGSGGMGSVYEAEHVHIGVSRALKVLLPPMEKDRGQAERFLRGARNAAAIRHSNVCQVHDFGVTGDGRQYLAMEFVSGRSLGKALQADSRFGVLRTMAIARSVAQALTAAHRLGIVHRDLKPDNVMLDDSGKQETDGDEGVKVVDFDIARAMRPAPDQEITGPMDTIGTPLYMSPEQVRGLDVDGRSDLYQLGLIVYRMLSGSLPFEGATTQEVMTSRLFLPPRPLLELVPHLEIPPGLVDLVDALLSREPEERPSTADEVVDVLDRLIHNQLSEVRGGLEPSRARLHAARRDPQNTRRIPAANGGLGRAMDFLVAFGARRVSRSATAIAVAMTFALGLFALIVWIHPVGSNSAADQMVSQPLSGRNGPAVLPTGDRHELEEGDAEAAAQDDETGMSSRMEDLRETVNVPSETEGSGRERSEAQVESLEAGVDQSLAAAEPENLAAPRSLPTPETLQDLVSELELVLQSLDRAHFRFLYPDIGDEELDYWISEMAPDSDLGPERVELEAVTELVIDDGGGDVGVFLAHVYPIDGAPIPYPFRLLVDRTEDGGLLVREMRRLDW